MVTFVDKDRVWIKSVQGLSGLKQVERRKSLCAWWVGWQLVGVLSRTGLGDVMVAGLILLLSGCDRGVSGCG